MGYACRTLARDNQCEQGGGGGGGCDPALAALRNRCTRAAWKYRSTSIPELVSLRPPEQHSSVAPECWMRKSQVYIQNYAISAVIHLHPVPPNQALRSNGRLGAWRQLPSYGNRNFHLLLQRLVWPATGYPVRARTSKRAHILGRATTWEQLARSAKNGSEPMFETGPLANLHRDIVNGLPQGGSYQNYQGGCNPLAPKRWYLGNLVGSEKPGDAPASRRGPPRIPNRGRNLWHARRGCYQDLPERCNQLGPLRAEAGESLRPRSQRWQRHRIETGPLRYPIGTIVTGLPEGATLNQDFPRRLRSSRTQALAPGEPGAISEKLETHRIWTAGASRIPTGTRNLWQIPKTQGCYRTSKTVQSTSTPGGGRLGTYGPIRQLWASMRYETGVLGYPTAAPQITAAAHTSDARAELSCTTRVHGRSSTSWGSIHTA
ncbi:hypothetical protein FQR65_LT19503 [Abscondita terminalis]|nr:hypothetical protein FQR65_LT19503 [Abscondita terminalis]